jgi:hypothetical protein
VYSRYSVLAAVLRVWWLTRTAWCWLLPGPPGSSWTPACWCPPPLSIQPGLPICRQTRIARQCVSVPSAEFYEIWWAVSNPPPPASPASTPLPYSVTTLTPRLTHKTQGPGWELLICITNYSWHSYLQPETRTCILTYVFPRKSPCILLVQGNYVYNWQLL